MDEVLLRAEKRRHRALEILSELGLLKRWSRYGCPTLVGAVRTGLVVASDIDMEIYTDQPRIDEGFAVMTDLAKLPGIWQIRFANELAGPDQGLYWALSYRDASGEVWKVDQWLVAHTHPQAHWADRLAESLLMYLTDDRRRAILQIKEALLAQEPKPRGVDIYRAVIEGGVRSPEEFSRWAATHTPELLTPWRPTA